MRQLFLAVWVSGTLLFCVGCASVKISRYIQEESPYRKTFYSSFEDTLLATTKALEDTGWAVAENVDPAVYERDQAMAGENLEQVLIFTEVRQTPFFVSSKYMNINIFLRSAGKTTDVEIRYQSVTPALLKNMRGRKNDAVVNRVLTRIEELLSKKTTPD